MSSSHTHQHLRTLLTNNCTTLKSAHQLHAHFIKTSLDIDPEFTGNLLLRCATTISDSLHYAYNLFLHCLNPNVFMYNTLIRGLSDSDTPNIALQLFVQMRDRIPSQHPDSFSFTFVLKAAASWKCFNVGRQLHCQALKYALDDHLYVGTTLISMYGECECLDSARNVFHEMYQPNVAAQNAVVTACLRSGNVIEAGKMFDLVPFKNITTWNVMLAGYMKAGEVKLAKKMFFDMPVKDNVSWSSMIAGCAQNGCFNDAFNFFRELLRVGLRPNDVSLTGVLSACAQAGEFEIGRSLHGFMEKSGLNWMIAVNNVLIDAYSRCGNVDMAWLVFERMPIKNCIVSWTSIIGGFAMHGHGEKALRLFNKMESFGIKPDRIIFVSILYACSHAGMVAQGYKYFLKMKDLYGIEPIMEHYGCVVDLYGRAGKLQEAYKFIRQMPIPPNEIIWRTLLGACGIHGNVKLAEVVKERLSELDPDDSGDYVLLSNVYATARKWRDVVSVRRTMAEQRIKKTPGWSRVEVDRTMYSFVAGGKQGKFTREASEKLKEIILKLRVEGGHVAEIGSVLHDIEEEEKEDSVSTHSEKLALAFGISRLREAEGKSLRIFKNLRICWDCHTMMKLVSKVYGLEIVLRDRSRFHVFKTGGCSCKDYW
ncbi:hypothetical protein ACFE04_008658 [Oxalis oulophora]